MAVRGLLVLTASELEARTLARTLGLAPAPGPVAAFTGGRMRVVCVGVAAARIERALPVDPGSTLVVSAGVCGALDPSLPVGALVVPETVAGTNGERWIAAAMPPLTARGTLLAVPEVVETAAAKSRLWMESGALALDMESGEICRWAATAGVPAGVVRGVSDAADRGVPGALAGAIDADGRLRSMTALTAVLSRPRVAVDAMALRAGTRTALAAVAAALARVARALERTAR